MISSDKAKKRGHIYFDTPSLNYWVIKIILFQRSNIRF